MTDREKLIELIYHSGILCKTCGEDTDSYCAETIADHLIANGVTVQQWIPVSERFPEKSDRYLVLFDDGHCMDAEYDQCMDDGCEFGFWHSYHHPVTLGFLDSEWIAYEGITHWMPLPEPPKEDK